MRAIPETGPCGTGRKVQHQGSIGSKNLHVIGLAHVLRHMPNSVTSMNVQGHPA